MPSRYYDDDLDRNRHGRPTRGSGERYRFDRPEQFPRGDFVCMNCGSDDVEPRRMRHDDRHGDRDEVLRRSRYPRDDRYAHSRYDDSVEYRGGDYGRDDVYPYSRSAMSGYEEPWHPGREREYGGHEPDRGPENRDFDDYSRRERTFRDAGELDYRLRERDHDEMHEDDYRWRR